MPRWLRTTHVSATSASSPGAHWSSQMISERTSHRLTTLIQQRRWHTPTCWINCRLRKYLCGWYWCPSLPDSCCSSSLCSFSGNLGSSRGRDQTQRSQETWIRMLMDTNLFISFKLIHHLTCVHIKVPIFILTVLEEELLDDITKCYISYIKDIYILYIFVSAF